MAIAKGASLFEKHVGCPRRSISLNAYSASPQQVGVWLESALRAFRYLRRAGLPYGFDPENWRVCAVSAAECLPPRPIRRDEKVNWTEPGISLAIPVQPGQITANDLSKYVSLQAQTDIAAGEPILFSQVTRSTTGKQSTRSSSVSIP